MRQNSGAFCIPKYARGKCQWQLFRIAVRQKKNPGMEFPAPAYSKMK